MFRVRYLVLLVTLAVVAFSAAPSRAAFILIGPNSPPGPNTGVQVNPNNNPGALPGNTTVATGHISDTSFVTWNAIGADSVPLSSNVLTSVMSPSIAPIAAVYLVSNSSSPTQLNPTPLGVSGTSNLQRATTGLSFSADFSGNEALLFANAANAALIIDFAVPITAAGFRIQKSTFDPPGSPDTTFFLQAFNSDGSGYVPASGLFDNLPVQTSIYQPFSDSAPFYGIQGDVNTETFTRLWIGFSGLTDGFAISTLEFIQGQGIPPDTGAVPVPPTVFAAILGMVVLRRVRRRR